MAPEPALMAGWQRRYNSQTMHCGANHPINDRSMTHARHPHEKRGLFHRFSKVVKVSLCNAWKICSAFILSKAFKLDWINTK